MQALVLMGVVLAAAVMWVGVIMTMLIGLSRAEQQAERRAEHKARELGPINEPDIREAPPKGRF